MFRHFAHIDLNTATYALSAILMALYAREFSGRGQLIEVPMFGAAMALQSTRLAEYFATGEAPTPLGSAAATTAPHEAFRCRDGDYIALGIEHDGQWQALCRALKRPDLAEDARFCTNPDRVRHRAELSAILGEIFLTKAARWWVILGGRFEFPIGHVNRNAFEHLRYHPQNVENGYLFELDTHWGGVWVGGPPWSFEKTPVGYFPTSIPGEHTRELFERVGLTLDEDRTEPVPAANGHDDGAISRVPAGPEARR
jgi:crotonobetainyl-CoA:carnitine CoA-transferase CaiB-like acyl-CoA transferase